MLQVYLSRDIIKNVLNAFNRKKYKEMTKMKKVEWKMIESNNILTELSEEECFEVEGSYCGYGCGGYELSAGSTRVPAFLGQIW